MIGRALEALKQGRFILPPFLYFIDCQGQQRDFVREFIYEEYLKFPFLKGGHDDMLDCIARIVDPDLRAAFPEPKEQKIYSFDVNRRYNAFDCGSLDDWDYENYFSA